jgi:Subtilase family
MANNDPKPHLRVDRFAEPAPYQRPKGGGGSKSDFGRTYDQHAESLKREVAEAWAEADSLLASRDHPEGTPGAYLAFETAEDAALPDLEWKTKGLRLAAAKRDDDGRASAAVFVPDEARDFIQTKLNEYGTERTDKGEPVNKQRFIAIDRFSAARLETLWVDKRPMPTGEQPDWWECWCWPDRLHNLEMKAQTLHLPVSPNRLEFPERVVVFVYATRDAMGRLVSSTDTVAELRLGRDTAAFFMGESRSDQHGWIAACVELLRDARGENAPAVCLLDTGVNRAHPLLEQLLHPEDALTVRQPWGTDDHAGHGTELAGLAVYGDLIAPIQSHKPIPIEISLESVKLLPPQPFPPTEPTSFGLITLQAVALPEINKPGRARVFCLAISQNDVSGPRASSWSAAIDQAASDADLDDDAAKQRRLFVIAAGNIPDGLKVADLEDWDSYEVEDPGQAWNAITVGGMTQKATITEAGREGWTCAVGVDELSPYSNVSASWNRRVAPIKPELIVEAGNRAVDPADESLLSGLDSLSLLTTGHDVIGAPLTTTWATSAAAAQVAGMAARLQVDDPTYWPETIRALLVHSAQWTAPMIAKFDATLQKGERLKLARRFGYGRPNLERARRSRSSSLAIVSQSHLQPFRKDASGTRLNQLHFYGLPWPKAALAEIAGGSSVCASRYRILSSLIPARMLRFRRPAIGLTGCDLIFVGRARS